MYDLGCPRDYTVDIHVITMVRIRLWLFGITSAMLDLRMRAQQTCRYEFVILSVLRNRESRHDVVPINCRDIQAKTQPDSSKIFSIIVPTSEQNQHGPTVVTMFRNEHTYNIGTTLVTDQCRY